jgi:hypothetical protein
MKLPVVESIVERRLLVNYRVDPGVAARLLPAPFRPQVVNGWAVAGVCLIRLAELRPRGLPRRLGMRSENAAHRIAVEWDAPDGTTASGVWIPRRHTGATFNALAGGRLLRAITTRRGSRSPRPPTGCASRSTALAARRRST